MHKVRKLKGEYSTIVTKPSQSLLDIIGMFIFAKYYVPNLRYMQW